MNIKKYQKLLIVPILAVVMISQFALPALAEIYGANPRFNIFTPYTHKQEYNRDYYLLSIRNETKNIDFNDPVSADPGDTLIFSVYYHNGVNETVAQNTKLKVALPSETGQQLVSTAYLWADNAENATPSNPFTKTGTVNASAPAGLEFIPGSVKWYPDQSDWRVDAPTPFPLGQTGNEIVTTGVNIGNIIGCWEFSGYINFKVKVKPVIIPPPAPEVKFNLQKVVQNLTYPNGTGVENIARQGDILQYTLIYQNTGDVPITNLSIVDDLPPHVILESIGQNGQFNSANKTIAWQIGTIEADGGRSGSVAYRVKVSVPESQTTASSTQPTLRQFIITNTAFATANEIPKTYSNEVKTTIGIVKGKVVTVVTGANTLIHNAIVSFGLGMLAIFAAYLIMRNFGYFTDLRLKLNILGIRARSKLI